MIFLAVIVLIIFAVIKYNAIRKKQKFKKIFHNLGKENEINISEFDNWKHYALGIDRHLKKILYLNNSKGAEKAIIINLSLIKSVEMQENSRHVKSANGDLRVLDSLGLKVNMKSKDAVPVILEFYNSDNSALRHHEMDTAEKWKQIIEKEMA